MARLSMLTDKIAPTFTMGLGASAEAIRSHYDIGDDFYRSWLDSEMVYSAACWESGDSLETAQLRKLDFHLSAVACGPGSRILDVGCGWGAMLRRAVYERGAALAVGLTLSNAQASAILSRQDAGISVEISSYEDFRPREPYSGIISVGAFEHFVTPEANSKVRAQVYRGFFERCHNWLSRRGALSLQTIMWGNVDPAKRRDILQEEVFPESDLPYLGEIVAASQGLFELYRLESGSTDYIKTLEAWLERLRNSRETVASDWGVDTFNKYERYLRKSIAGFDRRRILLGRFAFMKI